MPVTFSTPGHFQAEVTAQSLMANRRVDASANWVGMSIGTSFETAVGSQGSTQSNSYGLTAGNRFNPSWTNVPFEGAVLSEPGGPVAAVGSGSFSRSFELMVTPNVVNRIVMQISAGPAQGFLYNGSSSPASHSWTMSGYIDPVITMDAAYANRHSVLQSAIPMAPVPEAPVLAMMLSGLGLLAGVLRRGQLRAGRRAAA